MYAVLGGIYGALLSVMNLFNAQLSAVYGNWGSTVMIHAVGLLVLLPLAFTWGRPKGHAPWYLYGGGSDRHCYGDMLQFGHRRHWRDGESGHHAAGSVDLLHAD